MVSPAWTFVRGLEPVSFCDWPGKVTCVLFTGGCNFHCPTCHNATMAWCHETLSPVDRDVILTDLRRRSKWLDGVTVTGGEPTCVEGLEDILVDLAGSGLPLKLDSNGSRPDLLQKLLADNLVHTLAVDVKGPWRMYPELTGGSMPAETARENLGQIFELSKSYPGRVYFRCTKVPRLGSGELAEVRQQVPLASSVIFQEYVPPKPGDVFSKSQAN